MADGGWRTKLKITHNVNIKDKNKTPLHLYTNEGVLRNTGKFVTSKAER